MSEEKKEDLKKDDKPRQIIIETDGNTVQIIKSEVAGAFEFIGILEAILKQIKK